MLGGEASPAAPRTAAAAENQRVAPGGAAGICLGTDQVAMKTTSSNAYASGMNQNCGNVLTDRPVVGGVRQAPGGRTSIVLGDEVVSPVKPAKAMASPAKENEQEENTAEVVKENIPVMAGAKDPLWSVAGNTKAAEVTEPRKLEASFEQLRSKRAPPGGQSNIIFG